MKNIYALSLLLVLCVVSVTAQPVIRRVNNNPGVTDANVYTSLQAAHDAASNGDIIYIEPSAVGYGGLGVSKQLKIYGPGYFLDVNQDLAGSQGKNAFLAVNQSITFNNGSQGTEINGVFLASGTIIINVSNITVRRCSVGYIQITSPTDVSDIVIEQNFVAQVDVNSTSPQHIASNVIVQNNLGLFSSLGVYYAGFRVYTGSILNVNSIIVKNNHLWDINVSNTLLENNIISRPDGTFNCNSCTVQNNVAAATIPAGNGNQSNVIVDNEFVYSANATLPKGTSSDEGLMIKDASPLKTAGSGGAEVGAFGGLTPYVISGVPAIPVINKLYVTPTGSASTPISVTVSTKSNN